METVNTTCRYSTTFAPSCHCCITEALFSPAVISSACVAPTFCVPCPPDVDRNAVVMNGHSAKFDVPRAVHRNIFLY